MPATDTALNIAQRVAASVGFEEPTTLADRQSRDARTLLSLLNRGCAVLASKRGAFGESWPELTRQYTFTTSAGQEYYPLPDGFVNLITRTTWDANDYREASGPMSPQEWADIKNGIIDDAAISPRYRLAFNEDTNARALQIDPVPSSAEDIFTFYLSRNWARETEGGPVSLDRITADTQRPIFPTHLVELDLEWRLRSARGLEYRTQIAEFEMERDRLFVQAVGLRNISLSRNLLLYDGDPNVADGSWGDYS